MNELEDFFSNVPHRLMHKWSHYFEIYDRHLRQLRDKKAAENKKINLLEIGISHGGSLEMWNHYFKGNVNIYAVDINPECKKFETDNVKIFIGSQQDRDFLKTVRSAVPALDVLIDDGGHTMKQQIVTFEALYDHILDDGIYICEDLHTSYWKDYGGGLGKKSSFIEYSKHFIDKLHAWHDKKKIALDYIAEHTYSLHYYDSVLVIEKRKMSAPFDVKSGDPSIIDKNVSSLVPESGKAS